MFPLILPENNEKKEKNEKSDIKIIDKPLISICSGPPNFKADNNQVEVVEAVKIPESSISTGPPCSNKNQVKAEFYPNNEVEEVKEEEENLSPQNFLTNENDNENQNQNENVKVNFVGTDPNLIFSSSEENLSPQNCLTNEKILNFVGTDPNLILSSSKINESTECLLQEETKDHAYSLTIKEEIKSTSIFFSSERISEPQILDFSYLSLKKRSKLLNLLFYFFSSPERPKFIKTRSSIMFSRFFRLLLKIQKISNLLNEKRIGIILKSFESIKSLEIRKNGVAFVQYILLGQF